MATFFGPCTVMLTVQVRDLAGDLLDAQNLSLTVTLPDGTAHAFVYGVDSQLIRQGLGVYNMEYESTQHGEHRFVFRAFGDTTATQAGRYYIRIAPGSAD